MVATTKEKVIVVGAGLSGLSLARALTAQGRTVTLLDRGRGVGGRCATRRVNGERVDHGLPLLHGRSERFVQAVEQGAYRLLPDWPVRLRGPGTPCQPEGFSSRSRRWAIVEGLSAFAKQLATGLEVRLETIVDGLELEGDCLRVHARTGEVLEAATVVITCPVPQTAALLASLGGQGEELEGILALLRRVFTLPCLTLLAGYDRPTATDWQLLLPGPESVIHSLISDSSKRGTDARQTLVIQGSPTFSRENLEAEPERWGAALLEGAAQELGAWARLPRWQQTHRWRFARVQRGYELSHPVLLRWPGGVRLGLCGEAFNPAGGAEGAYLSGLELAERLLTREQ
jgi:renalase